ncbi:MAG TPA: bifunctional shikimate kinase/3-dehydroquinate synthase [Firmicutes bacterium]|nr:bifunctional shikimate kinase/3-dehydroquinate synthase [Bacillota bacterium]
MRIFLVGPTGVGKSTVGRILAARCGLPFVDSDELVAARAGRSIPDIFRREGEQGFRRRERLAVAEIARLGAIVAALGGGAVLDPRVGELVRASGRVVGLSLSSQELMRRLAAAPRPYLPPPDSDSFQAAVQQAVVARQEACRRLGPVVDVTGLSPEQAAAAVMAVLGLVAGSREAFLLPSWQLELRLPHTCSSVLARPGFVSRAGEAGLARGELVRGADRVLVVSSPLPYCLYGRALVETWKEAGATVHVSLVPDGERAKQERWLRYLWRRWAELGVERQARVVAIGGGAVSDLAGLAAATYLRGLGWGVIPTTLLAQVDAALGGKVAIDLPEGKNLVGAFHQPAWIIVDVSVLGSLPGEQIRAGLAEAVKCALLAGEEFLALLESGARGLAASSLAGQVFLDEVVRRCLAEKVAVVQRDERETGPRQLLNLGHTVGHAVEAETGWSHGEAVAVGLVAACRLAARLGGAAPPGGGLAERVEHLLGDLGLPVNIPRGSGPRVLDRMRWDKKVRDGEARFVLPIAPGVVEWGQRVPVDLVREVVAGLEGDACGSESR